MNIFWKNTTFQFKFDTLQLKRYLISSTKNIVYELSHELPRNWETFGKSQNWMEPEPSVQFLFQK